jgi:hypothetical protein
VDDRGLGDFGDSENSGEVETVDNWKSNGGKEGTGGLISLD